ncbi:Zn-dependent alcohol dehydrogenase [Streptomyces sp. NPDC015346]|uniref:Zn-dependent alcohol dehydrogenase n=1 Tax=Streptomyces sp. NPDC015346 TaxID=3364954 RepID=UPI0036FC1A47
MGFQGRTMRAAVMYEVSQPLVVEEVEMAEPGPGEVMVKLANSSVCHSDLHALDGAWPPPVPIVLGHEGAGTIEAVGPGVTRHRVGDPVVLSWTPGCERCRFCLVGRPNLCEKLAETVHAGVMYDGTTRMRKDGRPIYTYMGTGSFGEFTVVPETGAVAVPSGVPTDVAAVVGCAVTTGFGAATKTVRIAPGDTVVVIGLGGVGLSVLFGCAAQSAGKVIAVDVHDDKLAMAKRAGATHVINARETDPVAAIWELSGGRGADFAFEAIGLKATIEQALGMLGTRGTAVLVGMAPEGVRFEADPTLIAMMELRIVGSNYGSANPPIDFPRILGLAQADQLDLASLITSRVPLDDINDAFDAMKRGEGIRTVIDFT